MVRVAGLEPATSSSQARRATKAPHPDGAEVMAEAHSMEMCLCQDSGTCLTALASDCFSCRRSDMADFSWLPALRNFARTTKGFRGLIFGFMIYAPVG